MTRGLRQAMGHVGNFAADLGRGMVDESRSFVGDLGSAAGLVRRTMSSDDAVRTAQRATNTAAWTYVREHPIDVAKQSVATIVDPVRKEWVGGRPGAAIGRGAILALGPLLPGVGTEKLVRIADAAQTAAAAQAIESAAKVIK